MFKFSKETLSISQIWKNSFSLYKNNIGKVLIFAFLADLMPRLPSFFWSLSDLIKHNLTLATFYVFYEGICYFSVTWILGALITHYLYSSAIDPQCKLSSSVRPVLKKYPHIFTAKLLVYLSFFLVSIFMFVLILGPSSFKNVVNMTLYETIYPMLFSTILIIFIGILCLTIIPCILFEDKKGFSAIERSIKLVWGNWWRTFAVLSLPFIGIGFISFLLDLIVTNEQLSILLYSFLIYGLCMPFITCLILVQYNDLQLRKKNS